MDADEQEIAMLRLGLANPSELSEQQFLSQEMVSDGGEEEID
jgi:hypothetical protein